MKTPPFLEPPPKRLLPKLLGLLLGTCVALLLAEALVRLTLNLPPKTIPIEHWRMKLSENPNLLYEPIPHIGIDTIQTDPHIEDRSLFKAFQNNPSNQALDEGNFNQFALYPDTSNSLGFRGKAPSQPKNPQTQRVIFLGDSVVTGIWIENPEDLMHAKLEALLNQPQTHHPKAFDFEVFNFGVTGYNTSQEIALLEDRGLALQPDLVLLGYCLNDTTNTNSLILEGLHSQKFRDNQREKNEEKAKTPFLTTLKTSSALLSLLDILFAQPTTLEINPNPETPPPHPNPPTETPLFSRPSKNSKPSPNPTTSNPSSSCSQIPPEPQWKPLSRKKNAKNSNHGPNPFKYP